MSNSKSTTSQQSPHNNDDFKLENLFNVKDMVAVVSGGGSGIGLMCTQALAVNGAKVYIIGRTKEKLDKVVAEYGKNIAGSIIPIQGDISSKESIIKIHDQIAAKEKHVNILVNNAGVTSNTFETSASSAAEMKKNMFEADGADMEDWMNCFKIDVPQCFLMTMCFLPLLEASTKAQHGFSGCVINICSISGIVKTFQHHPAYNACKAAVIHLTKMTAAEIASNDIKVRVNSIAPGVFPSEMTTNEYNDDMPRKSHIPKEKFEGKVPAGRPGNDRDFGSGVLFVATNQYLNGQCVPIDGGYILQHGSA